MIQNHLFLLSALLLKGSKWRSFSNDRVCNERLCSTAKKYMCFFQPQMTKMGKRGKKRVGSVAFCFQFRFFPYPQIEFFNNIRLVRFLKKLTRKIVCVSNIRKVYIWKSLISEGKRKLPVCFGGWWSMILKHSQSRVGFCEFFQEGFLVLIGGAWLVPTSSTVWFDSCQPVVGSLSASASDVVEQHFLMSDS